MLRRVTDNDNCDYLRFIDVTPKSFGSGLCYVYGAVIKNTRSGKPFATLYLRDVDGNVAPGYVFDIASPLVAGGEAKKAINRIVLVKWQENYIKGRGLSLIVDKVSIVEDASETQLALFRGEVHNIDEKSAILEDFFATVLRKRAPLTWDISHASSLDYEQGRVGGLLEHYIKMKQVISSFDYLPAEEYKQLVATFLFYVSVHSRYIRARDAGEESIELVTVLTNIVSKLANALDSSVGSLEVVNMFFGYTPKDVYVRTIKNIADTVYRTSREFEVYHTLPLAQEGDAGYGTIRRYIVEKKNKA